VGAAMRRAMWRVSGEAWDLVLGFAHSTTVLNFERAVCGAGAKFPQLLRVIKRRQAAAVQRMML
jgi:hypothetical protein